MRKQAGVTLFEILLVLFIMSLLTVAAIRYTAHQREIAADQAYGVKLYIFGQAVRDYIIHADSLRTNFTLPGPIVPPATVAGKNPSADITITGAPTYLIVAKGVDWLKQTNAGKDEQGQPFLEDNFTFAIGMEPLRVGRQDAVASAMLYGDQALETTVTFEDTSNPSSSSYKITIKAGVLYEQESVPATPPATGTTIHDVLMPALTQDAVKHANELYTSYEGAAAIYYDYPYIDAATHVANPAAELTGVLSSLAKQGDAYLRTDGGNSMLADLSFTGTDRAIVGANEISLVATNLPSGQGATIAGVAKLSFDNIIQPSSITALTTLSFINKTSSEINNLQTLNFYTPGNIKNSTSAINNLVSLAFVPGTDSKISELKTINLTSALEDNTSNNAKISGLDLLKFGDGTIFTGIELVELKMNGPDGSGSNTSNGLHVSALSGSSNSHTGSTNLVPAVMKLNLQSLNQKDFLYPTNSMCFVIAVGFHDTASSPSVDRRCFVDDQGNNGMWRLVWNDAMVCKAACYGFAR